MEEKILVKGIFYGEKGPLIVGVVLGIISLILGFVGEANAHYSHGQYILFGFLGAIVYIAIGVILMKVLEKRELIVTNKRVIARRAFGIRKDFVIKNITDIVMYGWLPRSFFFDGISVATPSSRISFGFCRNKEELFNTISAQILTDNNT